LRTIWGKLEVNLFYVPDVISLSFLRFPNVERRRASGGLDERRGRGVCASGARSRAT